MRTFIAITLSDPMRENLRGLESALQGHLRGAGIEGRLLRWSGVEKAHVTVRFLGETDAAQRVQIRTELEQTVRGHAPFDLTLADLGCFPGWGRPQVVWVGVGGDRTALGALQADVEAVAQSAGFAGERRPYSPHITLARIARHASPQNQQAVGSALAAFRDAPPPGITLAHLGRAEVDHILLMRSELRPAGAVYTIIDRFDLG